MSLGETSEQCRARGRPEQLQNMGVCICAFGVSPASAVLQLKTECKIGARDKNMDTTSKIANRTPISRFDESIAKGCFGVMCKLFGDTVLNVNKLRGGAANSKAQLLSLPLYKNGFSTALLTQHMRVRREQRARKASHAKIVL